MIGNAAELRRLTFPPIRYVVPGYIAEGCTLLAGRPKLGKSWMVLESALAVARGGTCLGSIACEQGDVLYLALEDNRRRLQRRIDKLLGPFDPEWPAALEYATEWPRANEGGVDRIRTWILARANPRLVIVDVLAMFKPVRGSSESLYEADYAAIKGLQALAGEHSVAVVIVHHTRKSGAESDPFEKVSGTLGLSGAADTTLILDRDGNGATLYGRGRDIEEIESAVVFDKLGCRWHVQGEAAEVRRTDERGGVLAALEDADEPMSPGEVAVATGHRRNAVDQLLFKMSKAGEVLKAGRGRYVHPSRSDLIRTAASTPRKNDKKIRNPTVAEWDGDQDGDADLTEDPEPVRNEGVPVRNEGASEPSDQSAKLVASYLLTDLTGVGDRAGERAAQDVTFEQIITPMLDHMLEVADRAKVRGTIVASEPKRLLKRTNKHVVTVFTISALPPGVKASAGPLVSLEDKLDITPPHKRFITADLLGREPRTVVGHGGDWPCWIAVVEGNHSRCGYPTDPESFGAWFRDYTATNGMTVIGDWREEAQADGALDWLKREAAE
ncbi:AAA family ATPase [Methylobacterium phyllosphaerae]